MSDQSLRDALEKLAEELDTGSRATVNSEAKGWQERTARRVREMLAAHPVEPAREAVVDHRPGETCSVVASVDPETGFTRQPSDAAVEAAAKAACEAAYPPNPSGRVKVHDSWEEIEQWERDAWRATARAALVAAYRVDAPRPLLDREAVRKQIAKAYEAGMRRYNSGKINPPSEVAKVDEFTDAVMELARPMPTREQVAAVLREHTWIASDSRCSCGDEHIEFVSHHQAEAVLALLGGTEK